MSELIIDGKNALLGRLASYAAKQALRGKTISIINCEGVVISGNPQSVKKHYLEIRVRGGHALNGPFFPRSPERIVKRTIRGMLPYQQARGLTAFKRITCYKGTPDSYKDKPALHAGKEKPIQTISLHRLSEQI